LRRGKALLLWSFSVIPVIGNIGRDGLLSRSGNLHERVKTRI
jgi:hypothetical protein